jgi:hypothetical protein
MLDREASAIVGLFQSFPKKMAEHIVESFRPTTTTTTTTTDMDVPTISTTGILFPHPTIHPSNNYNHWCFGSLVGILLSGNASRPMGAERWHFGNFVDGDLLVEYVRLGPFCASIV